MKGWCNTWRNWWILTFLKVGVSMYSSWLSRTKLVPTSSLSSPLSCSRCSRLRVCPWCCILTHSLFISAKFICMNSTESSTVPDSSALSVKYTQWHINTWQEVTGISESDMWQCAPCQRLTAVMSPQISLFDYISRMRNFELKTHI